MPTRRTIHRYIVIRTVAGVTEFLTWENTWSDRRALARWFESSIKATNSAKKHQARVANAKLYPMPIGETEVKRARDYEPPDRKTAPADVLVRNEGTIVMLLPKSANAQGWVDSHLPEDCARLGAWYCVEHRYAADIINGMADYGLLVREGGR